MKTVDQLLADAEKIRIETVENNNDSERVGAALKDTISFMKDNYLYSGSPITLSLIYQEPVANFAALATTYPNPLRDWACMVQDQGVVYCYNGNRWASTGLKAFPDNVGKITDQYSDLDEHIGDLPVRLNSHIDCTYGVCKIIPHNGKRITGVYYRSTNTNVSLGVCRITNNNGIITATKIRLLSDVTVTLIPEDSVTYGNLYKIEINNQSDYVTEDDLQLYVISSKLYYCYEGSMLNTDGIATFTSADSAVATTNGFLSLEYIGNSKVTNFRTSEKTSLQNSLKSGLHLEETKYDYTGDYYKIANRNVICPINRKGNVIYGIRFYCEVSSADVKVGIARKRGDWYYLEAPELIGSSVYFNYVHIFENPLVLDDDDELYFFYNSVNNSLYKLALTPNIFNCYYSDVINGLKTVENCCPAVGLLEGVSTGANTQGIKSMLKTDYINFDSSGHLFVYKEITLDVDCSNPLKSTMDSSTGMFPLSTTNDVQEKSVYQTKGIILFPPNYDEKKKYPIVLQCHQGGADYTSIFGNVQWDGGLYLASLGYIVASTDSPVGWGTSIGGYGISHPAGNYAQMQSYKKLYDWIIENLSVNPLEVYSIGFSQGGYSAMQLAEISGIPIKAVAANCPVVSMKYQQWWLDKNNIAAIYGFSNSSNYEHDKIDGYDLYSRNATDVYESFVQQSTVSVWNLPGGTTLNDITMKRFFNTPVKIIAATNDSPLGYHMTSVFAKAIKNAGCICDLKVLNGASHGYSDIIGTFVYNGYTIKLRATAYEMAIWFKRWSGIDPVYTPL